MQNADQAFINESKHDAEKQGIEDIAIGVVEHVDRRELARQTGLAG